jgi:xylan 1,4-beta-xylosidase
MNKRCGRIAPVLGFLTALVVAHGAAADDPKLVVDCARRTGDIRPLHGVNNGPLDGGGLIDLSAHHRQLAIPFTRLHDVHWPNPDVVDVHAVFPDARADPREPASYDFARTDAYVRSIVDTGSRIVFRLGESIEHTPVKRHVHPPADAEKWAAVCEGIVRHYNEGWAGGFRYDIRHWEIWNEPDNRPAMWTGSDEDYFRLYAAAAGRLKRRWPHLKVGGPAVGNTGEFAAGALRPSPFVGAFLERCRRDNLPLDFFSWHCYTNDPHEIAGRARGVRDLLDRAGFRSSESHLNEWNYLPDNDWGPVLLAGQGEKRRRFYDRVGGAEGAAFAAATLLLLQDSPVDIANYYSADAKGFGLFTEHGEPKKTFHAFRAFKLLTETPMRVAVSGSGESGVFACAGLSETGDALTVLISNVGGQRSVDLAFDGVPWSGPSRCEVRLLDQAHDLDAPQTSDLPAEHPHIRQRLGAQAVCIVTIRPR